MRWVKFRLFFSKPRAVLPLTVVLWLTGCSGIPFIGGGDDEEQQPEEVELWSFFDQTVRLVPRQSGVPNDHPVQLSADEIRVMLGELRYQTEEDQRPAPVFSDENLQTLGRALSEGLAQAGPEQDVAFAIAGYHTSIGWLPVKRVNVGRAFYQNGELNLIFGQVLDYYRDGGSSSDSSHWEFGSREEPTELEGSFAEQPGLTTANRREDWVVVHTSLAGSPPASEEFTADSDVSRGPNGEAALRRRVEALEAELSEARRDLRRGDASITAQPAPAPSERSTSQAGIAERLTILKHLLEVDLITEDIYRQRVNRVLDEL